MYTPIGDLTVLRDGDTVESPWLCTDNEGYGGHPRTYGVVFLQTAVMTYRWRGDTTCSIDSLNPTGNGRLIDVRSGNLDTMDGLFQLGDTHIIYDYAPPKTESRALHLAAHLPSKASVPDQSASIEIPDEVTSVLAAIRQGHVHSIPLCPLPDLPWHEATRIALHDAQVSYICHGFRQIELYTDGSAGQLYADYNYYDHAAWGFVVIGWDDHPDPLCLQWTVATSRIN